MEKTLNKVNGFIPFLTALVVVFAFLFYMVAFFFFKGIDDGYGVSSVVGTEKELVATGLIILIGLVGPIALNAFWLAITNWHMIIVGLLIGTFIVLFDVFIEKKPAEGLTSVTEKYAKYAYVFLIFLYIFIGFPMAAYEKGMTTAHEEIKLINEKGCDIESKYWEKCSKVTYTDSNKLVEFEGLLLDKKEQEITIYLPEDKILKTFLLPSDAVIERKYIPEKIGSKVRK
ncbi:MAG: hypothetical protein ACJAZP_001457 [Psychromonas sp.]|jgi:hypothetical protein|uniref:hypothetical protein n=1 Tax=Psychromonas sp. TaxID=1884585 RepID=UPI0039E49200